VTRSAADAEARAPPIMMVSLDHGLQPC
jgi:hypothetical protein